MLELLNKIDIWNCSFCNEKIILSDDQKISYKDMICEDCKKDYTKIKYVDSRILENYKSYILYKNNSLIKKNMHEDILNLNNIKFSLIDGIGEGRINKAIEEVRKVI